MELFKNKNILIIGDVMLDSYIFGNVERISPEAPVPIVDIISRNNKLGGAANVASNIKNLQFQTELEDILSKLLDPKIGSKIVFGKDIKLCIKTRKKILWLNFLFTTKI